MDRGTELLIAPLVAAPTAAAAAAASCSLAGCAAGCALPRPPGFLLLGLEPLEQSSARGCAAGHARPPPGEAVRVKAKAERCFLRPLTVSVEDGKRHSSEVRFCDRCSFQPLCPRLHHAPAAAAEYGHAIICSI